MRHTVSLQQDISSIDFADFHLSNNVKTLPSVLTFAPESRHGSIAVIMQLLLLLLVLLRFPLSLVRLSPHYHLSLVVCCTLDLSSLFQSKDTKSVKVTVLLALVHLPCDNILILPSDFMAQSTNGTIFPPRLQPKHPKCLWYDHALLLVIWGRDTLEDFQTLHCCCTTSSFVWNHSSNSLVENARRCTEMEGSCSSMSAVSSPSQSDDRN